MGKYQKSEVSSTLILASHLSITRSCHPFLKKAFGFTEAKGVLLWRLPLNADTLAFRPRLLSVVRDQFLSLVSNLMHVLQT